MGGKLEIQYDKKVEKYFTDYAIMLKKIGKNMTRSVKKHIDNLKAANNFSIFLALGLGKPHSLTGKLLGCYALSVSANYRLIIQPKSEDLSPESLKKCDTIVVKGVEEYHAKKNEWIIP